MINNLNYSQKKPYYHPVRRFLPPLPLHTQHHPNSYFKFMVSQVRPVDGSTQNISVMDQLPSKLLLLFAAAFTSDRRPYPAGHNKDTITTITKNTIFLMDYTP